MKKIILGLLTLTSFFACADKNGYKIKGEFKVPGFSSETMIYLSDVNPENKRELLALDSVKITAPNYFEFEGTFAQENAEPIIRYIEVKDGDKYLSGMVIVEQGVIQVAVDSTTINTFGTPLNNAKDTLGITMKAFNTKMKPLIEAYRATEDAEARAQIEKQADAVQSEMGDVILTFIKANATNVLGQRYLAMNEYRLELPQVEEVLALIPEDAKQNNKDVKTIVDKVTIIKKTAVGQKYTDLKGPNPEGKEIALSDYVGKNKVVLVDFWASWCGPCRRAMPELLDLYKKYHKKGFEIVGVSLDKDKESWEKGIAELGLPWPQMSDLKFWDSALSKEYAVSSIPFTVLIGEDGTILATKIGGTELADKLAEIFKK